VSERVLVTGGAGFIGSAVVDALVRRGIAVTVLDNLSAGFLDNLPAGNGVAVVDPTRADVTVEEHVARAVDGHDAVVHLAALPWVHPSWGRDWEYTEQNVGGTEIVCRVARAAGVRRLVFASTAEVYGSAAAVPLAEDCPTRPASPYGASKIEAESVVRRYVADGLDAVTLRLFNAYGPRAGWPFVIPEVIRQAMRGGAFELGDTSRRRDFVFVSDTAEAILAALDGPVAGAVVNVGSGRSHTIAELVARVAGLVGGARPEVHDDPSRHRPEDPFELRADTRRAEHVLGWRASTSLDDGLRRTIGWYRAYGAWKYEREPVPIVG
jgi:UDP-glucose 4-epimerase